MNPWWRRPAAEDGPARPEPAGAAAPAADVQEKERGQTVESAAGTTARAAAEAAEGSAAGKTARVVDTSSLLVDAESPAGAVGAGDAAPEAVIDRAVQEEAAPETPASDSENAGEEHVSPALEAATEPAKPAAATPVDPDRPAPARRRRRRRRRRRGGRGRGRGRAPQPDESSDAVAKAAPTAGRHGSSRPQAGRAAALLDLGALKRDLGKAAVLDPEGLFARLDEELGKLVLRRVYTDAGDRDLDRAALHGGGAEVVDVPSHAEKGDCSAAVRIVVDALEICYTMRGMDTMVLVASSGRMLPLVAKLQQNGVTVIGLGGAGANARVRGQCDRFIDVG